MSDPRPPLILIIKYSTQAQTVFYKPLSSDENKDKVVEIIGSDLWDVYVQRFKEANTMYITVSLHNRLLFLADNKTLSPLDVLNDRMPEIQFKTCTLLTN